MTGGGIMSSFLTGAGGAAAGALVLGLIVFVFKESIRAALKSDVDRYVEVLKHDLQREMLKAELSTTQLHRVYPILFARMKRAEGALGDMMGLQFKPSYEDYDREDLETVLKDGRLPGLERARLLALIDADRREGIGELNKVLRRIELYRARQRVIQAQNYLVLKSLYLSDAVKDAAGKILEKLHGTWIHLNPGMQDVRPGTEALKQAGAALKDLEALMARELRPGRTGEA